MHSQFWHYMEVISHLHVHVASFLENKPAMCASNGRLNGPQNMEVSKKTTFLPCWECVYGSYAIHSIILSLYRLSYPGSYADKRNANRQIFVETEVFRTNG